MLAGLFSRIGTEVDYFIGTIFLDRDTISLISV